MKKLFIFLLLLITPLPASAKLKVVTTTTDLAALVKEVGGDFVQVESLTRGEQDPHFIDPKPSYAVRLNQADLLIHVGLELEVGWLPVLLTQSRNPKIQFGQPGYLDASEGLAILEIPVGKVDRSQGDIHPLGNPHYWLKPHNGLEIAKRISARLTSLDPSHTEEYQKNFSSFEERLRKKIAVWEKEAIPLKGKKIIAHHKSFSYFMDWTGLHGEGFIEPKPGIPPSPTHILSLIEKIKTQKIPLVITENYYDPKPSQKLAEKTGVKVLILPTSVGGDASIKTYEELFDFLLLKLKESDS